MHSEARAQAHSRPWRVVCVAILLAALAACGGGGGGGGAEGGGGGGGAILTADVYPLATGDRRTWRTAGVGGSLRSERTGAATTVGTGTGTALAVRSDDGSVDYLQKTASAVLSVPGPGSDALSAAAGAIELLRFGLNAGQTVVTYDRTLAVDLDADGRMDSIALHIESTFVGYENVDTAAGRFTAAAHVRTAVRTVARLAGSATSSTLNVTSDDWYAPGVGPVRSSVVTSGDGTPTQTDVEEVIAYGVGSQRSETVAPTLLSSSPVADGLASPSAALTLNFSEPLDPLTLDGSDGVTLVNAAGTAVAANRSVNQGGQQIVFQPQAALSDGRYELRTGGAVTDLANNPLPPTVRAFTVDTRGPRVVASTPAHGAQDGALTGTVMLRFDEPVFAVGSGPVQLQLSLFPNQVTVNIPALIQGRDIVATLTTPLERNREYQLAVGSAIADAAGNPVAYDASSIRFRTDPGPLSRPATLMPDAAVQAVTLGDVNNDGRRDLVFIAQQIGSSVFFVGARLQQADGNYAAPVRLHTLAANGICATKGLVVADFDGDGRADIAFTGCGTFQSTAVVLRQQAGGGFVAETAAPDIGNFHIAATDRLGDGHAELVIASFTQFSFLRRSTAGVWSAALVVDAGTTYLPHWQLVDLNGDGRADLVWLRTTAGNSADSSGYELAWALREGAGFGAVHTSPLGAAVLLSSPAPALAVGDVNGDGRPDVLLLPQAGGISQLVVLRQNASGGFNAPTTLPSTYYAATATVGDVDGDGRPDVVVSHSTTRSVGVYLQAADGSLQAERLFESGYGYFEYTDAVVLADLNADGRTDIVVTDSVLTGRPFTGMWPLRAGGAQAGPAALAATDAQNAQNTQTALSALAALSAPSARTTGLPRAATWPAVRALRALQAGAAARQ